MSTYFKFQQNDILHNQLRVYPKTVFDCFKTVVYLNNEQSYSGSNTATITHVPSGYVPLLPYNVDRRFSDHTYSPVTNSGVRAKIFPFIVKGSDLWAPDVITAASFNQNYQFGDILTGSYELSASITRTAYTASQARPQVGALRNSLELGRIFSSHYEYSGTLGDKATQVLTQVNVPKIFFNTAIHKGTLQLDFSISGTLLGRLEDCYKNGALYQTYGSGSGSVAGVVLYGEGQVLLTGSWPMSAATYKFDAGVAHTPKWTDYMAGCNDGNIPADISPSASFRMSFEGINTIPTVTMLCTAPKGQLNHSTNPTFVQFSGSSFSLLTSSNSFQEKPKDIKNIVSSSFYQYSEDFKKETYLTKVLIYDNNKNLLGVAHLARPLKKTEEQEYTIKLQMDF